MVDLYGNSSQAKSQGNFFSKWVTRDIFYVLKFIALFTVVLLYTKSAGVLTVILLSACAWQKKAMG